MGVVGDDGGDALGIGDHPDAAAIDGVGRYPGSSLASLGAGLVVLGLVEGPGRDWDAWTWAALIGGPLVLGAWALYQRRPEASGARRWHGVGRAHGCRPARRDDLAFAPLALCGLGLGLLVVPLVDVALATVDVREAGAASGTFGMVQQLGAALGIAVIGVIFFGRAGRFDLASLTDAMAAASLACAIGYAGCALAAAFLPAPGACAPDKRVTRNAVETG